MKFKKIAVGLSVLTVVNSGSPAIKIFADEIAVNKIEKVSYESKSLLGSNKTVKTQAKTREFKHYDNTEYSSLFKMDNDNIQSIKNNAGHYASQNIEKAVDEKIETYWETKTGNSQSFNNEVEIEFKEKIVIDRIVYGARQSDVKGFAEEFEIYASNTSSEDDYQLVATGKHDKVYGLVEAKFNPTEFKKIKFKFKKSNQNWATLNEIAFYTQDEVYDKIDRLFTDDSLSVVNEEFNTLEKIEALEEQAKNHPLYNEFKESIDNAKSLVTNGQINPTKSEVSIFKLQENEEYNTAFKMEHSNIKSIKNNGGHYAAQNIEKAIDNDLNTYWETKTGNNQNFNNEIEIDFNENIVLNRIVYGARPSDAKGFAEEFEIYASTTTKGGTFKLVTTGKYNQTKDLIEAKFEPTEFRRVKFKFKKSNQDWATAREFMFYKEDKLTDEVNSIFVDGTNSKLKPEYTETKLNELKKQANNHPLKEQLNEIINYAKNVLNNPDDYEGKSWELERRGNSIAESQKRKVWNFQDWLPTGYSVKSGDIINVYVDVEKGDPTPSLVFKQMESAHNGNTTINLSPGKNTIVIPEVEVDTLPEGVAKAGVLYTINPYTEKEQSRQPKIRIEGADQYPHYILGVDSDEEVMKELEDYVKLLEKDKTLPNVFEIFSEKGLINVRATDSLNWFKSNNKLPSDTAKKQDEVIRLTMDFWGFDNSSEINSDFNFRYVSMIKNLSSAYMNANNGITGVQRNDGNILLGVDTGWGTMHEMGHNFDTRNRLIVEVTNNILPLQFQRLEKKPSRIYDLYEDRIFNKVIKEDYSNNDVYPPGTSAANFSHIAVMWQLALYDEDFYPKFEQAFRASNFSSTGESSIHNEWSKVSSDIYKMDMSEHFERHGVKLSKETKEYNSKYPKLNKKTWYLNDNKYLNDASVFTDKLDYKITSISKVNGNNKLEFDINKEDKNNLMGYEIYKNDELIGFTHLGSFVDTTSSTNKEDIYKIVAFDGELNSKGSHSFSTLTPKINLKQKKINLALNESFEPKNYVKAFTYEDVDISNDIKINHNVDTSKRGLYNIEYSIENENITVKENVEIEVVSKFDYLSDIDWENIETGYGTPDAPNTNITGRVNGNIETFEKGITLHANGKVVYNLENYKYDNFEALVGIHGNMSTSSPASVKYTVKGDGKVLHTTNVLKASDDLLYISVPIKGVKNLTIEIDDAGNGNGSDNGVIANPKLSTNDSKPELKIEEFLTTTIGNKIEVGNIISAIDIEDGDLKDKVVIEGNKDINFNVEGEHKLIYSVEDSDGNKVSKEQTISVVNMIDYKYLTDYDWRKATTSYGTVQKDKASSGNNIRLTGENNQEVVYKRGLGTHAHSEIVYDLSDKDYKYFTSYVGVDRNMYGSVASIEFKVFVDGVEKYSSGLMNSTDKQKFVNVDINGAKELKLVVTDGGNGIGSDHGSWGDTKLHFVNTDKEHYNELEKTLNSIKELNKEEYTKETISILNDIEKEAFDMLEIREASKEEVKAMNSRLQEAISNLEKAVDLNEVVVIKDKYLKDAIKDTLNINSDDITIGDMYELKSLDIEPVMNVRSLKGLEHAINLESLNINYNEISDISYLNGLKKLNTFTGLENYLMSPGKVSFEDNKFIIEDIKVIDIDKDELLPKEIVLSPNESPITLKIEDVLVDGKIVIDGDLVKNTDAVDVVYESKTTNFQLYSFYFLKK
ncbi:MAG: NPCBM/NEW2 domain-containing protein [Peptostreptococcaceae bacterium]